MAFFVLDNRGETVEQSTEKLAWLFQDLSNVRVETLATRPVGVKLACSALHMLHLKLRLASKATELAKIRETKVGAPQLGEVFGPPSYRGGGS